MKSVISAILVAASATWANAAENVSAADKLQAALRFSDACGFVLDNDSASAAADALLASNAGEKQSSSGPIRPLAMVLSDREPTGAPFDCGEILANFGPGGRIVANLIDQPSVAGGMPPVRVVKTVKVSPDGTILP